MKDANIFTAQIPDGWYSRKHLAPTALTKNEVAELQQRLGDAAHAAWLHANHFPLMPGWQDEVASLIADPDEARDFCDVAI